MHKDKKFKVDKIKEKQKSHKDRLINCNGWAHRQANECLMKYKD